MKEFTLSVVLLLAFGPLSVYADEKHCHLDSFRGALSAQKMSSDELDECVQELRDRITDARTRGNFEVVSQLTAVLDAMITRVNKVRCDKEQENNEHEKRVLRACYGKSSNDDANFEKALVIGSFVLFALPVGILLWKSVIEFMKK
mgnify:CR=1 FL=1